MIIENGVLKHIEIKDVKDGKIIIPSNVKKIDENVLKGIDNSLVTEIELSDGVEEIGDNAFYGCDIKSINLPSSVRNIGKAAFYLCKNLTKITLPENLEKIGEDAFHYTGLQKIKVPKSVKEMGASVFSGCQDLLEADVEFEGDLPDDAFSTCEKLTTVRLSDKIKVIGKRAFQSCEKLVNIDLSHVSEINICAFRKCSLSKGISLDNAKTIDVSAFEATHIPSVKFPDKIKFLGGKCFCYSSLKSVTLPNVEVMGQGVFAACKNLKRVDLGEDMSTIPEYTFYDCKNLRKLTNGKNIRVVSDRCFSGCSELANAEFIENVEKIMKSAFENCENLRFVNLKNVSTLEPMAFSGCRNLEFVDLSKSSLRKLEEQTFESCKKLRRINLPQNLEEINSECFQQCRSLHKIDFPTSLRRIEQYAFVNSGLKIVKIPEDTVCSDNAFSSCNYLRKAEVGAKAFDLCMFADCLSLKEIWAANDATVESPLETVNSKFKSLQGSENGIVLACRSTKLKNCNEVVLIKNLNGLEPMCLFNLWDQRKKVQSEVRKAKMRDFYNFTFDYRLASSFKSFVKSANVKYYKKIPIINLVDKNNSERMPISDLSRLFYNLYYNLGGFLPPQKETRTTKSGQSVEEEYNYAQKVGEFFREKLASPNVALGQAVANLGSMMFDGNKPEFTKFILEGDNFDQMLEYETLMPGFIGACYNEFEQIQKTNTSNRGSQRQLKPTVKKFKDYFRTTKFRGVTAATEDIAETISPYFEFQETFEDAVEIDNERKTNNVPDDILQHPVEEKDVFAFIDEYAHKINKSASKTTKLMEELLDTSVVAEWMKKSDPRNFILGKLCDCCAHLEGAGYGIMRASIVAPDVQNLILKDSSGRILAKSTLYVNRQEGYGVFNNVEVGTMVDKTKREQIHKKYKLAAAVFAKKYNEEHPDTPLTKITVGMGHNDIDDIIRKEDKRAEYPLHAIPYNRYGGNWGGDSREEQYIVWENEDK